MQTTVLLLLSALVAVALAGGQFYVPRAYYTIDAEGHASAPVPLRRLRRSLSPYPYEYGNAGAEANANANAEANSEGGGSATANANANAQARGYGGWSDPRVNFPAPNALRAGQTKYQYGAVQGGRMISASTSVGIDSTGQGYYNEEASTN